MVTAIEYILNFVCTRIDYRTGVSSVPVAPSIPYVMSQT